MEPLREVVEDLLPALGEAPPAAEWCVRGEVTEGGGAMLPAPRFRVADAPAPDALDGEREGLL